MRGRVGKHSSSTTTLTGDTLTACQGAVSTINRRGGKLESYIIDTVFGKWSTVLANAKVIGTRCVDVNKGDEKLTLLPIGLVAKEPSWQQCAR